MSSRRTNVTPFVASIHACVFLTLGIFVTLTPSAHAQVPWTSQAVFLDNFIGAVRVDAPRNVIYASVPLANRVYVLDLNTLAVIDKLYVGFHPYGIDLSLDNTTLYAAESGAGAIGVYDLVHQTQSDIDISIPLGNPYTYDVVEAAPGLVFASADPGSSGLAYIVRVDMATGASAVVANGQIIRSGPIFAKDPSQKFLYVPTESGGLNRLDITKPTAPIEFTSSQYLYGTTTSIDVNPTGDRLVLGSGEVLRANELTEDGTVGNGVALFTADGSQIVSAIGSDPVTINLFDATTLDQQQSIPTTCSFYGSSPYLPPVIPTAIRPLPGRGWVVIGNTMVCVVRPPDAIFGNGFD
jgi:DNA-binding beta-propeller fold protein YncE